MNTFTMLAIPPESTFTIEKKDGNNVITVKGSVYAATGYMPPPEAEGHERLRDTYFQPVLVSLRDAILKR
jgi:hypothetical protein